MKKTTFSISFFFLALFFIGTQTACSSGNTKNTDQNDQKKQQQTEKDQPQKAIALFNGKNTDGWHTYNKDSADACWRVEDGALTLDHNYGGGGTLVTDKEYKNYILTLKWKISQGGNSGILINAIEDSKYQHAYVTAPEMQVLDNKDAEDNKDSTHLAGSLYDLIACPSQHVHPAGEWNQVKIKQIDGKVTFWINDYKVATVQIGSEKWADRVANSKFSSMNDFGKSKKGHIGLQDHGHKVAYKDIQIQEL